ncbi:MAG: hypothetical protein O9301_00640 [Leptospira sp.]|nr:hypothetical protein [Leptospira sp.]
MTPKITKFLVHLTVLSMAISLTSCDKLTGKKDSDDENAQLLLLGAFVANENANAAARKNAAQIRSATSAATTAITTQAQGGSLTFNGLPLHDRQKTMAILSQRISSYNYQKNLRPNVIPTALSTPSGSCNTSSCNATLNGTENCSVGDTKSGTFSTTNLQVTLTITGNPMSGNLGFSGTMKGDLKMDKCQSRSPDYFNFPSMTTSITTGDLNYDGSNTQTLSNVSFTAEAFKADITVREKSTTISNNMQINGGAAQSVRVTQDVNLVVNSVASNLSATSSDSEFSFKATYVDTLTGTVSVTGTVGSGNVNVSRTYNNDKFTYDVNCAFNINNGSGDCTITVK